MMAKLDKAALRNLNQEPIEMSIDEHKTLHSAFSKFIENIDPLMKAIHKFTDPKIQETLRNMNIEIARANDHLFNYKAACDGVIENPSQYKELVEYRIQELLVNIKEIINNTNTTNIREPFQELVK